MRRAPEIRVHENPGRIDDRLEACGCGGFEVGEQGAFEIEGLPGGERRARAVERSLRDGFEHIAP